MATRTDKVNTPVVPGERAPRRCQDRPRHRSEAQKGARHQRQAHSLARRRTHRPRRRLSAPRHLEEAQFRHRRLVALAHSDPPRRRPRRRSLDARAPRLRPRKTSCSPALSSLGNAARSPEASRRLCSARLWLGSSFLPTENGTAGLQALADRAPPEPVALEDVTTDVKRLFNIELKDEVPLGHKVRCDRSRRSW